MMSSARPHPLLRPLVLFLTITAGTAAATGGTGGGAGEGGRVEGEGGRVREGG